MLTSTFCERSSSSLKCVNNYMRCFPREGQLSYWLFISMNKDFLKMKVKRGTDALYNKMINEFAKKK